MIYLSKMAFDSLLESRFKETQSAMDFIEPITLTVEDLEDYIEGYSNTFDDDDEVEVSVRIDNIYGVSFDQTFGNIPFKAEATVEFSNPIEPSFSSAMAQIAFKGIAEIDVNDDMSLIF